MALREVTISRYLTFPRALGKWVASSSRIWRVFWNKEEVCLEVLSDTEGLIRFQHEEGRNYVRADAVEDGVPRGLPATAVAMSEEKLKMTCTGTTQFYEHGENNRSFLDILNSWGGEWMWKDLHMNEDSSWVAECLENNTLVCVTDGSYQKELAPELCSAGWILYCRKSGRCISGTLVEKLTHASREGS